jgi:hypothetical protein
VRFSTARECAVLTARRGSPSGRCITTTCFSHNWEDGTGLFMQHFDFTLDYPDGKIVMYKRGH